MGNRTTPQDPVEFAKKQLEILARLYRATDNSAYALFAWKAARDGKLDVPDWAERHLHRALDRAVTYLLALDPDEFKKGKGPREFARAFDLVEHGGGSVFNRAHREYKTVIPAVTTTYHLYDIYETEGTPTAAKQAIKHVAMILDMKDLIEKKYKNDKLLEQDLKDIQENGPQERTVRKLKRWLKDFEFKLNQNSSNGVDPSFVDT